MERVPRESRIAELERRVVRIVAGFAVLAIGIVFLFQFSRYYFGFYVLGAALAIFGGVILADVFIFGGPPYESGSHEKKR